VPDCHRCSKVVTNHIPTGGRKIIQIKYYRNLKIPPILKAPKVAQRTKVILISLNSRLGLTDWRYVFVADFEARHCQVTRKFIRCRNAETRTVSAIKYTACYKLAVLVIRLSLSHFCCIVFLFVRRLCSSFAFFIVGLFYCVEKNANVLQIAWAK